MEVNPVLEEEKLHEVTKALKGLEVVFGSHYDNGALNMAKVNGSSIVWHRWSYGYTDPTVVEVMFPFEDDVEVVEINRLRHRVISAAFNVGIVGE